jgi:hypothetical protein
MVKTEVRRCNHSSSICAIVEDGSFGPQEGQCGGRINDLRKLGDQFVKIAGGISAIVVAWATLWFQMTNASEANRRQEQEKAERDQADKDKKYLVEYQGLVELELLLNGLRPGGPHNWRDQRYLNLLARQMSFAAQSLLVPRRTRPSQKFEHFAVLPQVPRNCR